MLTVPDASYAPKLIDERRLCDAVDVLLSLQNPGGGFASYETIRAPHIIEKLNPAEVFGKPVLLTLILQLLNRLTGNIMTEYAYPECTTSVITALSIFKKHYPKYRAQEIEDTTREAIKYLHGAQRQEGGWFGSWGICFTYATMFALESLSLVGENYRSSERAKRACEFLVSKQKADGGWGESYKVC